MENLSEGKTAEFLYHTLPSNIYGKSQGDRLQTLMQYFRNEVGSSFQKDISTLGVRIVLINTSNKKDTRRRTSKYLSRKEKIAAGLLKLPRTGWNYESLQEMRNMWNSYMSKVFGSNQTQAPPNLMDKNYYDYHNLLSKIDLTGGDITVIKSRAPNLVDISGTIVLETKQTFQVVTKDNKLKILLKEPSVFVLQFNKHKITIFGKALLTRPHERCTKKIKSYINMDL